MACSPSYLQSLIGPDRDCSTPDYSPYSGLSVQGGTSQERSLFLLQKTVCHMSGERSSGKTALRQAFCCTLTCLLPKRGSSPNRRVRTSHHNANLRPKGGVVLHHANPPPTPSIEPAQSNCGPSPPFAHPSTQHQAS